MNLQQIKDELKEMYPNMQGFIQHTLVAEMCFKWHEKQVKNCTTPNEGQSERLKCDCCNGTGIVEGEHYDDLQSCNTCLGRGVI